MVVRKAAREEARNQSMSVRQCRACSDLINLDEALHRRREFASHVSHAQSVQIENDQVFVLDVARSGVLLFLQSVHSFHHLNVKLLHIFHAESILAHEFARVDLTDAIDVDQIARLAEPVHTRRPNLLELVAAGQHRRDDLVDLLLLAPGLDRVQKTSRRKKGISHRQIQRYAVLHPACHGREDPSRLYAGGLTNIFPNMSMDFSSGLGSSL
jgi:hypothetical protein